MSTALGAWLDSWLPRLAAWDLQVVSAVRAELLAWPQPAVSAVALLSHLGDRWVIAVMATAACAWVAWRGEVLRGAAVGLLLSIQGLLVWTLKDLALRARPPQGALDAPGWVVVHGSSLPSGHATASVVAFGLLAWLALRSGPPRWRRHRHAIVATAAMLAAGVGVSRVLLGVHYPSDVLAGWCLGCAWLALSLALLEALPGPTAAGSGPARRGR